MQFNLWQAVGRLVCYDGEESQADPNEGGPSHNSEQGEERKFTQADVNRFMAEDRRKQEQKILEKQRALEKTERLLTEALEKYKLTDQERIQMQAALDDVQAQLRTKEQQAALDKKKLEDTLTAKLKSEAERASYWENLYKESRVVGAIERAGNEHGVKMLDVLIDHLRPRTKLIEDPENKGVYREAVEFEDIDPETQKPVKLQMSAYDAVKRMKEMDRYAYFFGTNAAGGLGGQGNSGRDGRPDPKQLVQTKAGLEQFVKLFREDPRAALGLK